MIQYNFYGGSTPEQQEASIKYFERSLGSLLNEFAENGGQANIDYSIPKDCRGHIQYWYDLCIYDFLKRQGF